MRKICFLCIVCLLYIEIIYADDINDEDIFLDETATELPSVRNIPDKLIPDSDINDRNSFMKKFGFSEEKGIFSSSGFDLSGNRNKTYITHRLTMANNIQVSNIWNKKNPIIEASFSAGVMSFNNLSVSKEVIKEGFQAVPYGKIHFRFGNGSMLMPEFSIEDTGLFLFDKQGIYNKKGKTGYNSYFIKFPLGFHIPFFNWQSMAYIDGRYSSRYSNFLTKETIIANNKYILPDTNIYTSGSDWIIRLYLDTPVILFPSIREYSYFGIYYCEQVSGRLAKPGSKFADREYIFLNTKQRSGGIFYDMRKDVYKGILFGIELYGGYAEIETGNGGSIIGAEYNGIHGMLAVKGKAFFSYEYIFQKYGLGISIDAGVEYNTTIDFIFSRKTDKYTFGQEGDLLYFAALNFMFAY